jgi:hypothetical protein
MAEKSISTVLVVVNANIRPAIQEALDQYKNDLKAVEGQDVIVVEYVSGSPSDLKAQILGYYKSLSSFHPLVGCLFVGDLPIPWYGDLSNKYPIDMYYMDLEGDWEDTNGDGIFDQHPDELEPLIWVGRLAAGPIDGAEAELLMDYFDRIHRYRIGQLDITDRAMAYVDDDWIPKGDYGLSSAYSNVTLIDDVAATNADDYINRLNENIEFVHVAVHSTPFNHTFKQNHNWDGSVANTTILNLNPHPAFFCLDACQSARYTENNYIGGCYIFSRGNCLVVIGETMNANSMDGPKEFYSYFGEGLSLGDSFIKWLKNGRVNYHLDRTILGDPALRKKSQYISSPSGLGIVSIED